MELTVDLAQPSAFFGVYKRLDNAWSQFIQLAVANARNDMIYNDRAVLLYSVFFHVIGVQYIVIPHFKKITVLHSGSYHGCLVKLSLRKARQSFSFCQ